ncbi:hypothetical protein B0H10DRAFT_2319758 [Mycena sp. CBHHK59/15]|nr:hypothetical protein B0H10DRAFT_2319758 [Mycena sp. CBHHK59/15]
MCQLMPDRKHFPDVTNVHQRSHIGAAEGGRNAVIPRNTSGRPVLPSINLDTVPIADIRMLLCDYFDQCWADRGSNSKVMLIPWEHIVSNPKKYYDTEAQHCSIKLDHLQNLSTIQVLSLANDLLGTSVMESPTPFRFLVADEVGLIPSTPPVPPPLPPPISTAPTREPTPILTPPPQNATALPPPMSTPAASPPLLQGECPESLPQPKSSKTKNKRSSAWRNGNPAPANPHHKSTRTNKRETSSTGAKACPGWAYVDLDGNEVDDSD